MARKRKRRVGKGVSTSKTLRGYTGTALLSASRIAAMEAVPPSSLQPDASSVPSSAKYVSEAQKATVKQRVIDAIAMQLEGKTRAEVAETLGISYGTLRNYFYQAGKEGWLVDGDVRDKLEFETVHKVVRNINESLDGTDLDKRQEMTIEAAKGLGLFKKHEVVQNDSQQQLMALSIRIEQPEGPQDLAVGSIGGVGAYQTVDEG